MKKVHNPYCLYCTNTEQTVTHLFSPCPIASSFLSDFVNWYQSVSKESLSLSKNEILYGVLNGWSSCSTLNHLILIGKYFVYCKALNHVKFQYADFVNLVNDKIETECYIALNVKQTQHLRREMVQFHKLMCSCSCFSLTKCNTLHNVNDIMLCRHK